MSGNVPQLSKMQLEEARGLTRPLIGVLGELAAGQDRDH